MSKLSAIARYEVLMAWRRRSLPILWILLFVGVVGFALLITSVNSNGMSLSEIIGRNANLPAYMINTIPLINIMLAGALIYAVGLTLMLSETIPLDRQFKVRELLDTLPISRATYLGGKLLGVWSGLIIGWIVVGVVSAASLYVILGAYDLRAFALLWTAMVLVIALMASALSVLLGAWARSRRTAVLIGLALLPVVMVLIGTGLPTLIDVGGLINPIYTMSGPDLPSSLILSETGRVLAQYVGVIVVVWTLVWAAMRMRGER